MPLSLSRSPRAQPDDYTTPASPPESQRSREPSWSSVYVTPYKARVQGAPADCSLSTEQPAPVYAPASTQRSAKRHCTALMLSAIASGTFWSLGSPALLALLGREWWHLALARLVLGLGAVLAPSSLFRSLRSYVRAALLMRAVVWLLILPTLWLALRSSLGPAIRLRSHLGGGRVGEVAFLGASLGALLLDAAAAAVPAAVGSPDGFRIERHLLVEYAVCAPPRLLATLRRRYWACAEAGVLVLAPALCVAALMVAVQCGRSCEPEAALLPAALALLLVLSSALGAAAMTTGGRGPTQRAVAPAAITCREGALVPSAPMQLGRPPAATPPRASAPAAAPLCTADAYSFTPTGARRSLSLPPIPTSASEAALQDAVGASVAALAASRAAVAEAAAAAIAPRARLVRCHPLRAPLALLRGRTMPPTVRGPNWRRCDGARAHVCLLALAHVVEDAVVSVALPLLCLRLSLPQTPSALLWAALCTCVAICACRIGRLAVRLAVDRLSLCGGRRGELDFHAPRPREHAINRPTSPSRAVSSPHTHTTLSPPAAHRPTAGTADADADAAAYAHDPPPPATPPSQWPARPGSSACPTPSRTPEEAPPARAPLSPLAPPNTPPHRPDAHRLSPHGGAPARSEARSCHATHEERGHSAHSPLVDVRLSPPEAVVTPRQRKLHAEGLADDAGSAAARALRSTGSGLARASSSQSLRRGLFDGSQASHPAHASRAEADEIGEITVSPLRAPSRPAARTIGCDTAATIPIPCTPPPRAGRACHARDKSCALPTVEGSLGGLFAAALATAAASAALAAAQEVGQMSAPLVPFQPHVALCAASCLVGACVALACASLHARLSSLQRQIDAAAQTSTDAAADCAHSPCGDEWRDVVDGLRALGAIAAQPALCAALGLWSARMALCGAAAVASLAVAAAAVAAACARLAGGRRFCTSGTRRECLLGGSAGEGADDMAATPDATLLLTAGAASSASGATWSPPTELRTG